MELDELQDGTFTVWHPNSVDLIKSATAEGKDAPWKIGGFCSTSHLDRQAEAVMQKGLDFSEFVQHGWFNDNHAQHAASGIGIPEMAELRPQGWYTEGHLIKDFPRAQEVFQLAKALQSTNRRLGFSIEGKVIDRIGNKICKALIRNVAITNSPVNTNCSWSLVAKSWAPDLAIKALEVGADPDLHDPKNVFISQDLEDGELRHVYQCPQCRKAFHKAQCLDEHITKAHTRKSVIAPPTSIRRTGRALNKSQALEFLSKIRPEWSESLRSRVIEELLKHE